MAVGKLPSDMAFDVEHTLCVADLFARIVAGGTTARALAVNRLIEDQLGEDRSINCHNP